MACLALRTASVLLALVMALCLSRPAAAATYSMLAGVSGPSYFWTVVSEQMAADATVSAAVTSAIQDDLQTAAGTGVTATYVEMQINASAMYLSYTADVVGTTPTEAEVQATVATATFPKLTAALATLSSNMATIADLVPTTLSVVNPLYPDPDASSTAGPGYTIVGSVNYEVVVLFSGTPAAWTTVLAADRAAVSANVVTSVATLMNSSRLRNDVTVSGMSVLAADADKKSMGSGAGGLEVRLSVVCSGTTALTGRYLSTDEYASALMQMDTTALTATFQASSGSTTAVTVEETTSVASLGTSEVCDASCKGMIIMAGVVAVLVVICAVLTIVAIACPCGLLRSPRDPYAAQLKQRGAVETEVAEAADVYGNEERAAVESHEPTAAKQPKRRNTDPHYE